MLAIVIMRHIKHDNTKFRFEVFWWTFLSDYFSIKNTIVIIFL